MEIYGSAWKITLWNLVQRKKKAVQLYLFRYEEYQAAYLLENPNAQAKDVTSKYLFPLQRIKTIMKQDPNYAPKTDAVTTMSKATEYFGDFLLEEVKRIGEGKNRVDYKLLYDCISNFCFM